MQLAAKRLRNTHDSLAAVAADVGYESEASFNRAFKRITGLAPGRWREVETAHPRRRGRNPLSDDGSIRARKPPRKLHRFGAPLLPQPERRWTLDQADMTRFTAFGPLPFLSGSTSKVIRCPSFNPFKPARSTAVM